MDYSMTISKHTSYLIIKTPGTAMDWWSFLQVYSLPYWLMICLVTIVLGLLISIGLMQLTLTESKKPSMAFLESLIFVGRAILGKEVDPMPNTSKFTLQILVLNSLAFGFICMTAYNAKLFSLLAVKNFDFPIHNAADILSKKSNVKILIARGNSDESIFRNAPNGTVLHDLWGKRTKLIDFDYSIVS